MLGVLFITFLKLLFICLLIFFTSFFFAYSKFKKVLTGFLG